MKLSDHYTIKKIHQNFRWYQKNLVSTEEFMYAAHDFDDLTS